MGRRPGLRDEQEAEGDEFELHGRLGERLVLILQRDGKALPQYALRQGSGQRSPGPTTEQAGAGAETATMPDLIEETLGDGPAEGMTEKAILDAVRPEAYRWKGDPAKLGDAVRKAVRRMKNAEKLVQDEQGRYRLAPKERAP